jgi:hypothetical protein
LLTSSTIPPFRTLPWRRTSLYATFAVACRCAHTTRSTWTVSPLGWRMCIRRRGTS